MYRKYSEASVDRFASLYIDDRSPIRAINCSNNNKNFKLVECFSLSWKIYNMSRQTLLFTIEFNCFSTQTIKVFIFTLTVIIIVDYVMENSISASLIWINFLLSDNYCHTIRYFNYRKWEREIKQLLLAFAGAVLWEFDGKFSGCGFESVQVGFFWINSNLKNLKNVWNSNFSWKSILREAFRHWKVKKV